MFKRIGYMWDHMIDSLFIDGWGEWDLGAIIGFSLFVLLVTLLIVAAVVSIESHKLCLEANGVVLEGRCFIGLDELHVFE